MNKRYEVFCLADRRFYETPDRIAGGTAPGGDGPGELFGTARRPVPAGWRSERSGDWLHLHPPGVRMPPQGWKIHASACPDNADRVAGRVWEYCVPRGIPFKFVPGRSLLFLRNSKYAGRDSSGKFATLYPRDEEQLHTVLRELGERLSGEPGPYILTDLRWGAGPLHVRWGAFAPRHCDNGSGTLVPAVEDPSGRLVPDRRDPVFTVPEWVTLPAFLEPELAARNGLTVADLPYRIEQALHFSNGGGVYRGTDPRSGAAVVLKEARPHAGLASDGADAVTRLRREKAALERLAGLSVAPAVRDWLTVGEHRFLVMDHVPGRTLNSFFAERHPLLSPEPAPAAVADYTRWALDVLAAVERAVAALHGRGVVFNDLHMFNIMVGEDEKSVTLLDFEAARLTGDEPADTIRQTVAHPGFVAPADRSGFAIDRYALACLRLALFVPMTTLLAMDRGKAAGLAEVAARQFPGLPPDFPREAVAEITAPASAAPASAAPAPARSGAHRPAGTPPPEPADWPAGRDAMIRAILASATPGRDDRLFPGDIAQFAPGGGLGLAHGAAGVLYALAETGAEPWPEGERWLLRHAADPPPATAPGLWDGLMGVAYALHRLGRTEAAAGLAHRALGERWERLPAHLHGGLAGIGLVLDELAAATGDPALERSAALACRLAADRVFDPPEPLPPGPRRAGLLYGATGPALLFLRRHRRTGDPALPAAAEAALARDLAHCAPGRDGALAVDEGRRTMPYLGEGSVGIAAVLDDYLAVAGGHPGFERARRAILPAARLRYYAQPGLFQGRAGMIWHLGRTTAPGVRPGDLAAQTEALGWHAMPCLGGLAFPGEQLLRLSMDLATGTAGCLLALGSALGVPGARAARLPFLPPPGGGPQTGPRPGAEREEALSGGA
ncbi:class III lanthionine synthetase LanKC [Streptomyces aidingensis]|uniref:Protein kinase domain-containing protein n=1 Tax=Streptomyces aidingensis TaxID=910347 RepID=A0A1I1N2I9_9ACTN|nr:class III lanthionine synthetase LanKC [Streptomyces aidingensis]SFC89708.1 Protein kinase domain-containing protein [Streptomyces aidingensis]